MRKPKLALVLPIVQVGITAILTQWADRVSWILLSNSSRAPGRLVHLHLFMIELRVIWRGVNAPAFPVGWLAELLPMYRILGFGVDDLFYLAGVFVLWYLVGRRLDRCRIETPPADPRTTSGKIPFHLLIMALGMCLLFLSLLEFHREISFARDYFIRFYDLAVCTLFLLWSLILLIFSGVSLTRGIRSRHVKTDVTA